MILTYEYIKKSSKQLEAAEEYPRLNRFTEQQTSEVVLDHGLNLKMNRPLSNVTT
jgi:hypothetical protein